ncbi:MAG: hypothetical protein IPP82_13745 [Xanthomonadales bacterium]|nr:hypothetical protein [Xanthomonadales bacterium]
MIQLPAVMAVGATQGQCLLAHCGIRAMLIKVCVTGVLIQIEHGVEQLDQV